MWNRSRSRTSVLLAGALALSLGVAIEQPALAQKPATKGQARPKKKDRGPAEAPSKAEAPKPEAKAPAEEPKPEVKAPAEAPKPEAKAPAEEPKPEAASADPQELDTRVESPKAVYLSGDFAFTRSDLGGISDSTGFDRTVANGLLYGLSTGLRLRDLRLGARWRVYDTTEFTLWTVALSAGYALPLRPVTPILSGHLGYVFDQHIEEAIVRRSLPPGTLLPPELDVKGLLAGVDLNASYWVTQFFRLGAFIGADLMFLSREQAKLPPAIVAVPPELERNALYTGSGSAIGLNVSLGIRGAFDIAFK